MPRLPSVLEIHVLKHAPRAVISVPGSKSITNRALVLGALTSEKDGCKLHGVLRSEDTEVMLRALDQLGFQVRVDWDKASAVIVPADTGAIIPASEADIHVGNSGTTMRFLAAMVSLGHGRYRLDGVPRMRERPINDLLDALQQLGVDAQSENNNGCPPVVVTANGLSGGHARLKGHTSSQFLSGLLMALTRAKGETTLEVTGPLVSQPYVSMTVEMMRHFGAQVETPSANCFRVLGRASHQACSFEIEPDASAASYFFGAAAVTRGRVCVFGLSARSIQGDIRFVNLLEEMGCRAVRADSSLTVQGGALHGIDVDMNDISDCVMTLAAVACFAEGPTTIRNVAHIRHKETDRLRALATELRKVGAGVDEFDDGLTIHPRPLHGAEIETYDDHRMAMSMSLIGLRVPGIVIKNPGCVAKTYPGFFADLEKLRQE